MNSTVDNLQLDIPKACIEIESFIRSIMKRLNREGAVIGLSGGLDSAVTATLTVRSLGKENVTLFNLPEKDSKPIHKKHAKQLANHLGIKLKIRSVTPMVRAAKSYRLLPIGLIPGRNIRGFLVKLVRSKVLSSEEDEAILANRLQPKANSWIAKGNAYSVIKHRMRMIVLYQYAELNNLMVVGAANRTEWLTGTFSKWGVDHCADIMPLLHVYRSQLEQIAEYLKIPDYIRLKYADPDVLPGIEDKGELMGSFSLVDQVLVANSQGQTLTEMYNEYGKKNVDQVLELKKLSAQMRESPYHLELNK